VTLSAPGGNATSGSDGDTAWIWSLGNSSRTTPVASPGGDVLRGMIGTLDGVTARGRRRRADAERFGRCRPRAADAGAGQGGAAREDQAVRDRATGFAAGRHRHRRCAGRGCGRHRRCARGGPGNAVDQPCAVALPGVAAGEGALYRFTVPAGVRSLNLRSYGGTGDVSLYVARNVLPTTTSYLMSSARLGNAEAMVLSNPAAGTYYLRMVGVAAASNVTVLASY
jgi:serine protease